MRMVFFQEGILDRYFIEFVFTLNEKLKARFLIFFEWIEG